MVVSKILPTIVPVPILEDNDVMRLKSSFKPADHAANFLFGIASVLCKQHDIRDEQDRNQSQCFPNLHLRLVIGLQVALLIATKRKAIIWSAKLFCDHFQTYKTSACECRKTESLIRVCCCLASNQPLFLDVGSLPLKSWISSCRRFKRSARARRTSGVVGPLSCSLNGSQLLLGILEPP